MLDPKNTIVAMITVDRPGGVNYVHRTIKSLAETGFFERFDKLHLVLGCSSPAYVKGYEGDPGIILHEMTSEESECWRPMYLPSKCAYGHNRMMKAVEAVPGWTEALFLEDDIIFSKGWLKFLDTILPEIRKAHDEKWMLALYQHYGVREEYEKGRKWYPIKLRPGAPYYHGGLAEVHTRWSIKGLVKKLEDTCISSFKLPSDYATGEHILERGGSVLATAPSLVEHVGVVSTGLSGGFHQSDFFKPSATYSQFDEEEFITGFFSRRPPRYKMFCDVGAFDGIYFSNTRTLFESGWNGILVEPNPLPFANLERLYRGTKAILIQSAVGDARGRNAKSIELMRPISPHYGYGQISTCIEDEKSRWGACEWDKTTVPFLSLSEILARAPEPVEFLSIDCEGMDVEVLESAGFSAGGHLPRLVMIEHNDNRNQALERCDRILAHLGYSRVYTRPVNAAWELK